ncbi:MULTISPECIES: CPCC family cysteine-rich protein [Cysteiniphilum]|uniref:Membrane protein n=1 Tax=Cysteiniphilum litorale TaxID=2056700 RepID=A0A8J3EA36_9GAMM|nr:MULTISPECIES: CPCC family cysteine-rich protein [Cysteiniphilum]GGG06126.1 membrane protein [Cysteiniphilum litorale]
MSNKYACPCCGFLTYDDEPNGTFEICPVCFWEDDDTQNKDPKYCGGANKISLEEARQNFVKYGAINLNLVNSVRSPHADEYNSNYKIED